MVNQSAKASAPVEEYATPRKLRARKAAYVRFGNAEKAEQVDQELRTAVLEKRIRELVDQAPPLTDEQRSKLAALLVGGER